MKNIYNYLIIISVLIIVIILHHKYTGINAVSINKGNRGKKDNVKILLSRIKWVNKYKSRINYYLRYIIYSIVISSLVCIIIQTFSLLIFIQLLFIIWLTLYSLHNYFYHHSDKYAHYYIDDNVSTIQKILNFKNITSLPTIKNNSSILSEGHNFI